jgi:hypothetical protein
MSSRAGRARRAWRGIAAAGFATFVATASHVAVTGAAPGVANLALALGLAAPICVLLTARAPSWWRLSVAVVLSQVLFHSLLALDLGGASSDGGAVSGGRMLHHGAPSIVADAAASALPALHHGADSPWMWAAHALAAVITIAALGSGERALRRLAEVLTDTFRALVPFRTPRPAAAPIAAPAPSLLPAGIAVLSSMRRRGPPLAV